MRSLLTVAFLLSLTAYAGAPLFMVRTPDTGSRRIMAGLYRWVISPSHGMPMRPFDRRSPTTTIRRATTIRPSSAVNPSGWIRRARPLDFCRAALLRSFGAVQCAVFSSSLFC